MEVDHITTLAQSISLPITKALHIGILELNRKRKLPAEQQELPSPKHKCTFNSFLAKPAVLFNKNGEIEDDMHSSEISESGITVDNGTETEYSNSFVGDSECVMSGGYSESKYKGLSLSVNTFVEENEIAFMTEEEDRYNELQTLNSLEDPLFELGSQFEYICSQHTDEDVEQYSETMIDDVLCANEQKPNAYVLSSGRWSASQDSRNVTKKPTIDQEFEQYFSTLML